MAEHKHETFGCEQHEDMAEHHEHMDRHMTHEAPMHDHERGAGHPAHHTKGKLPSQLNPDHGPHGMAHPHGHVHPSHK